LLGVRFDHAFDNLPGLIRGTILEKSHPSAQPTGCSPF
jgi:hypothetical protein